MSYTLSIPEILARAEARNHLIQEKFGTLTASQLNWKPAPEKWSIAQCLDHLIVSNSTYIEAFESIASGKYRQSFWEKYSPFSKFLGRKLYESMLPTSKMKMKSPPPFAPSQSDLPADIVARFLQHNPIFFAIIAQFSNLPITEFCIASPAMKILTYSLADVLNILDAHEERHFLQAQNLLLTHPHGIK